MKEIAIVANSQVCALQPTLKRWRRFHHRRELSEKMRFLATMEEFQTALKDVGGKLLATRISERTVLQSGGALFLIFAVAELVHGPGE